MFLCMCHAVTDKAWAQAVHQHQGDVTAAMGATQAGTCCGSCREELEHAAQSLSGVSRPLPVPMLA